MQYIDTNPYPPAQQNSNTLQTLRAYHPHSSEKKLLKALRALNEGRNQPLKEEAIVQHSPPFTKVQPLGQNFVYFERAGRVWDGSSLPATLLLCVGVDSASRHVLVQERLVRSVRFCLDVVGGLGALLFLSSLVIEGEKETLEVARQTFQTYSDRVRPVGGKSSTPPPPPSRLLFRVCMVFGQLGTREHLFRDVFGGRVVVLFEVSIPPAPPERALHLFY